ncbi:hypothetical protein EW146_g5804 [Bondarzewia mesenterica]|uniref:UDENN domain-containing protein n=1 Tax=Bondarzewia mesenterica TaxID=1095465 RepID=A0A4S4LQD9_9AGAM|nr:hypothetical protein EW146_g5804 [Bondarzewia mesenterica]
MAALEADPNSTNSHFIIDSNALRYNDNDDHDLDDDADTASARSISLSSPAASPRHSTFPSAQTTSFSKRESRPYTVSTDHSSDPDDASDYTRPSSVTSAAPSTYTYDDVKPSAHTTYPPPPPSAGRASVASFATSASSYSKKARPESMLLQPPSGPLVLGIALVDFNHQVGPRIEFSKGAVFEDEEIAKILPFLALPDGAHLTIEDYSYFHLVPSSPNPSTIFGISCNRQIATSTLLVKEPDMTRSTVQKAVVVLASKPVFGPIRDRLGVVTMALFEQRDFTETDILVDFYESLERSLRSQLTESGLYMGTSLRELVHEFRQKTLILVKALILQKKIMFYGHPVERLCTFQYSLISLVPGLLQTLDDCGSPPLASRAPSLSRPTSLRTSDRKSLLAYLGLPLDLFGQDAFFQPYLPLQQIELVKSQTKSFLCGSTNSIVTQQKDVELLVNIETGVLEFRDPRLERAVGLTAADRKWMDEIVRDVNESWDDDGKGRGMQRFKGSDDYLRIKVSDLILVIMIAADDGASNQFEEYISAALASVKYGDFLAKGEGSGVLITPGSGGDPSVMEDFNQVWIAEFKRTNAFQVWQRVTDPMLFDIIEPRHPCNEKPSAIADISLRLAEGIQDLKLDQQLAPTREAISRTFTAGSTGFFKAVEGVRGRWIQRSASSTSASASTSSIEGGPMDVSPPLPPPTSPKKDDSPARPPSISVAAVEAKERIGSWGAGIGSFFASRAARLSKPVESPPAPALPPKDGTREVGPTVHVDAPAPMSVGAVIAAPSAPVAPTAPAAVPEVAAVMAAAAGSALLESFKQEEDQDQEEEKEKEETPIVLEETEGQRKSLEVTKDEDGPKAAEEEDSGSEAEDNPYGAVVEDKALAHAVEDVHGDSSEDALKDSAEEVDNDRHVHAQARGSDASGYSTPRSVALSLESRGDQEYEPFGVAL